MGLWDKIKEALVGAHDPAEHGAHAREAAFVREVMQIAARLSFQVVEPHPEHEFALRLRTEDDREHTLYLHNLFTDVQERDPQLREATIDAILRGMLDTDDPGWDEAEFMLVPLLRVVTFDAALPAAKRPPHRAFLPFLNEIPALDFAAVTKHVTPQSIADWGVGVDHVYAIARRNFQAFIQDDVVDSYDPEAPYPIWCVATDDDYQASRLMMPGWLASFRGKVNGQPVAIVPTRSLLVVTGDADVEAMRRLLDVAAREYVVSARRISPALYGVDQADQVVPLVLPDDHPLATAVAGRHIALAINEYRSQREVLEQQHQQQGLDVFVAKLSELTPPGKPMTTWCAWPSNVTALLPKAELIMLQDPVSESGRLLVRWSDVEAVAGECWQVAPGLEPLRIRTSQSLDEAALAKLRCLAVDVRPPDRISIV
jgi:hypothetical protein